MIPNPAFQFLASVSMGETSQGICCQFSSCLGKLELLLRLTLICCVAVDKACPSEPQFPLDKVREVLQE